MLGTGAKKLLQMICLLDACLATDKQVALAITINTAGARNGAGVQGGRDLQFHSYETILFCIACFLPLILLGWSISRIRAWRLPRRPVQEQKIADPVGPSEKSIAKNHAEDLIAGRNTGADDYDVKPISSRELPERMETDLETAHKNRKPPEAQAALKSIVQESAAELEAASYRLQDAHQQIGDLNQALSRMNKWLADANENMLSILNQLRAAVIIINPDGRMTFISQMAEEVFNRDHSEALGQLWESFLPLLNGDKVRLKEMLNLPCEQRTKIQARWNSSDGQCFWMEIDVKDDPRDPANRIFYFHDVSDVADLRIVVDEMAEFHGLWGQSKAMQLVYKNIRALARVDTTVLIEGETGTGKELVARAIHYSSIRKGKPFLAINCAGLTESLLTSQLFGHNKGSFIGAVANQAGLFEAAHGGSLFLDEVGDIPISIQSSLLRVLQEKEITRLGETQPRRVDVRIIAATHRELNHEVALGNFREDLFYRINVAKIELPPLRNRLEDLQVLVAWSLGQACASMGVPMPEISSDAMEILTRYRWPGNVRELKSAVESAIIRSNGSVILPRDLPPEVFASSHPRIDGIQPDERQRILEALKQANGNRTAAARLLGISRATFYRTLARLNLLS